MSKDSIVKCHPFDKVECCFDTVAVFGNNVEATFDIVERIVQFVAFDNIAGTLLLVWTRLKTLSVPQMMTEPAKCCILSRRFTAASAMYGSIQRLSNESNL